jgi:hypothetical protein
MDTQHRRRLRLAAGGAVVLGLAAGSYGVAGAASGSGTGATAKPSTTTATSSAGSSRASSASNPWAPPRSDETLLTGDTAAKVRSAALAEVAGATIVRVETDADGHAVYEAHMTKQDGTPVTVYVDQQFDVVR